MKKKELFIIHLAEIVQVGEQYEISLSFLSTLSNMSEKGFIRWKYISNTGHTYWFGVLSLFPTSARRVFPCIDEPKYKAPFKLSVDIRTTQHGGLQTITTESLSQGDLFLHYNKTPPASPYSLGLVTGVDFLHSTTFIHNVQLTIYGQFLYVINVTEDNTFVECFHFMQNYLQVPFGLKKLDFVIVPKYPFDHPIVEWGIIVYGEDDMKHEYSQWGISSGIATQWFGHQISPYWWDITYSLNAAFVKFFSTKYIEWKKGRSIGLYNLLFYTHPDDRNENENFVKNQEVEKVTWILYTLFHVVSNDTFMKAVRNIFTESRYSIYHEYMFWDELEKEGIIDGTLPENFSGRKVFNSWYQNNNFPIVTVKRDYSAKSAVITQKIFSDGREFSPRDYFWHIPIMYITRENQKMDFANRTVWMLGDRKITINDLPSENDFMIVNPGNIGMYIVNYDEENWALLSDYMEYTSNITRTTLEEENLIPLSPDTRLKLLHDTFFLANYGYLSYTVAMNMTLFLKHELNIAVWQQMLTIIDDIERLTEGTPAGAKFMLYSTKLLEDLLTNLKDIEHKGQSNVAKLKYLATEKLQMLSNEYYESQAKGAYQRWLQRDDPAAEIKKGKIRFCQVFRWGSLEEYSAGLKIILNYTLKTENKHDKELLYELASCPREEEKINELLHTTILGDQKVTDGKYLIEIFNILGSYQDGQMALYKFVYCNWEELKKELEQENEVWNKMLLNAFHFKSKKEYSLAADFIESKRNQFDMEAMDTLLQRMKNSLIWRYDNLPHIESWVDNYI